MSNFNIKNSKIEQLNEKGNNYKLSSDAGNNVVSDSASIAQAQGSENRIQIAQARENLWLALWKRIKLTCTVLYRVITGH